MKKNWIIERTGLSKFPYQIEENDNSTAIARVGTLEDAKTMKIAHEMLDTLKHIEYCLSTNQELGELTLNDIRNLINEAKTF